MRLLSLLSITLLPAYLFLTCIFWRHSVPSPSSQVQNGSSYKSRPSTSQEPNDQKMKYVISLGSATSSEPSASTQMYSLQKITVKPGSFCWFFSWDTSYLPDVSVILTNRLCFALSLSRSCCTALFVNVQEQSPLFFCGLTKSIYIKAGI